MPEWRRFWVFPAILIVVGGINMALTLASGFPFALLFLLALLVIIAVRAPYAWGWLTPPPGAAAPHANLRVAHDTTPAIPAMAPIAATPIAAPETATIDHEAPAVIPPADTAGEPPRP
jgi:hypothetical protein